MGLPLSKPFLETEELSAVIEVMNSKYIASGQVTKDFENALALKFKRKFCTVVNSGTTALYLALKVLALKKVIIPSITCPGVLHAVINAGADPVFADVDAETHNIDLSSVSDPQIKESDGLIVTHTYGHSAEMDIIEHYVKNNNLILVEDFAQSMGGSYKDKITGSMGKISITSFYAGKNMTTGYGGAVFTDDPEVNEKVLYVRGDRPYEYYGDIVPLNYKLTDIQSALGLVQLKKIDQMVDMRRKAAQRLTLLLNKVGVKTPVEKPGVKHAYYKYPIVLPEYVQKRRFMEEMKKEGVATGILYEPPLHQISMVKSMFDANIHLQVSENVASRTVSLPMFAEMTDTDIYQIYNAVGKALKILT
jgi:perosamine synthetase